MPWRLFLIEEGILALLGVILCCGVVWDAVAHQGVDPVLAALAGAIVNHFAGSQVADRTARSLLAQLDEGRSNPRGGI